VYAFLSAAPFIFVNDLHQPIGKVGVFAGIMVLGMAVGNSLTARLSNRLSSRQLLRIGNGLSLASAIVLLAIASMSALGIANTIGLMLLFTTGCGMTSPAALARAVSVDPKRVGSAAGLYGCAQMAIGAACTTLAAAGHDPARTALTVMVGAGLLSHFAFTLALRHER
jgi:DHA1 family bicyclomycin/chloramphenicol resistance-like MFS transporter